MAKRLNTQTGRIWWFFIPVMALIIFGCEKDMVSTVNEESGRTEIRQADAVSKPDVKPSPFVQDDEADKKLGECLIMKELPEWPSDYFDTERAYIRGDIITFNVTYPGGAWRHDFRLVSTTFKESYPVQVSLQLFHDSKKDPADGIVSETLRFDLSPLKDLYLEMYPSVKGKGTIIINVIDKFGSQESAPLVYRFADEIYDHNSDSW